ncbi:hypothetical protein CSAL01_05042 [Colletotrichum salicis]|uniref:Uncharacterized protein n=1 Tax=Colletotrichum salicis TaxID=1209931 RepID=A0A135S2V2_9PEZI|nr:hypothetical protein CSAL01_05042 [Colletotrichum salicis]
MNARSVLLTLFAVTAVAHQANIGYERLGERRDVLPPIPGMDFITTLFYDTVSIINEIGHWLAANVTISE